VIDETENYISDKHQKIDTFKKNVFNLRVVFHAIAGKCVKQLSRDHVS